MGIGEEGEGWVLERRERGRYWRGGRGVGIGEEGEGGYWRGGRGVGIGEEGEG